VTHWTTHLVPICFPQSYMDSLHFGVSHRLHRSCIQANLNQDIGKPVVNIRTPLEHANRTDIKVLINAGSSGGRLKYSIH